MPCLVYIELFIKSHTLSLKADFLFQSFLVFTVYFSRIRSVSNAQLYAHWTVQSHNLSLKVVVPTPDFFVYHCTNGILIELFEVIRPLTTEIDA